jgi:hypothetical protein
MVSLRQRRLKVGFVVAILETLVIVAGSALLASLSGRTELLAAALSATVGMGVVLAIQWHRLKHGATTTFMPELMPAIVVSLVATRAFSASLPETMSGAAMLSLELLCAVVIGGAMSLVLNLTAVRKTATAVAESLM